VTASTETVVALGASAGGVEALTCVLSQLPPDLGAVVLVVLHTAPGAVSRLPEVLARAGPLPVAHARDGEQLEPNRVYVAPPDHHLLVADGQARVVRGPHENRHRPAVDPLFRSAAVAYRERLVAVILTGALDDGAAGCLAVKRMGGQVLVQDPAEAAFPSMPQSAIAADHPTAVLPAAELGAAIVDAVRKLPAARTHEADEELQREIEYAVLDEDTIASEDVFSQRSAYSCPSCGGSLWEAPDDDSLRFRCRIGHAFGSESLLVSQSEALDASLAAALRALHERADLARRVSRRMRATGRTDAASRYDASEAEAERDASLIRSVLLTRDSNGA